MNDSSLDITEPCLHIYVNGSLGKMYTCVGSGMKHDSCYIHMWYAILFLNPCGTMLALMFFTSTLSASPRRKPLSPVRRRSPVAHRRGESPRRRPDSPQRRRMESPVRRRVGSPSRRGETPPRRRPASPARRRSPSPAQRRQRSPARLVRLICLFVLVRGF